MLFRNVSTVLPPLASLELCSIEMFSFLFSDSYLRNLQLRDRKRRKHSNNTEIIFTFDYLKITLVEKKRVTFGEITLKIKLRNLCKESAFSNHLETHVFPRSLGNERGRGGGQPAVTCAQPWTCPARCGPGGKATPPLRRRALLSVALPRPCPCAGQGGHPAQGDLPGQGSPGGPALPRRAWPALEGAELWPPVR